MSPVARVVRGVDAAAAGAPRRDAFPTGFPSIDNVLGGGARRGDILVLGGDAGCGKSSLALAIALRMAQDGVDVAFLTHEMTVERVLERALAIEGRCRIDDLRSGALDDEARAMLGAAAVRLRENSPRFEALAAGGTDAVRAALQMTPSTEVVMVDPLQAIARGERPFEEEVATAMHALKRLALELNVAVLVTSNTHTSRDTRVDPRPTLDDFGALGAVKQVADAVLGVFREEMYHAASGIDGATELLVLEDILELGRREM
jgi:replicative DNA helicase